MSAPPRSHSISADVRAYLDRPRYATIATVNEDGSPHQAVIWYRLDGDRLIINSRGHRRWPRNLLRDPRLALAVHDEERAGHWIGLRGRAEQIRSGEAAAEDILALARRYGWDLERFRGQQDRITFAVQVERTFEYWS